MCDGTEDRSQLNSSKELLYSDFTGNTVVEHVLNSLQKPDSLTRSEEINKFLKSKGEKSEAVKRAKRFLSLVEENDKGKCLEASVDDEKAIEVHLTIGKENFDTEPENYKADAWFILPQSKVPENSEECLSDLSDIDDSSSDLDSDSSSDDEYIQHISFPAQKKNLIIEEESSNFEDECKPL